MGTGLLGEGMFDSVLRARDLWLRYDSCERNSQPPLSQFSSRAIENRHLPRQARDEHKGHGGRFCRPGGRLLPSTARMFITGWQHPATAELLRLGLGPGAALLSERLLEVSKKGLFLSHLFIKNDLFTKTGSGQI
jgi:hypothetical protein